MFSSESSRPVEEDGLLPGLSKEEGGLYLDGLTQTCAALRRRIAELESDNKILQRASKAAASINSTSSSNIININSIKPAFSEAKEATRGKGETWTAGSPLEQNTTGSIKGSGGSAKGDTALMLTSGVGGERGDGCGGDGGHEEEGFANGGRNNSPRSRLSWMAGRPRRTSTAQGESDCEGPLQIIDNPANENKGGQNDGASRRLSAVPSRLRYSVGFSRFSLPPNSSPPCWNSSVIEESIGSLTPRGSVSNFSLASEALTTLTHPLTGDEKDLAFMEFAIVGLGPAFLSGARPLQAWGQDVEVTSGFPPSEADAINTDDNGVNGNSFEREGAGDGSFVQGLGDFCFPCGAGICLVKAGLGMLEAVPEDRMHVVQFTDCENVSTYGCCLTVTHLMQNPSPRLVKRLQEREETHEAARKIQRFLAQRACSSRGERQQSPNSCGTHSTIMTPITPIRPAGQHQSSLFGFQTPPPDESDSAVDATGARGTASDDGPTYFSDMMNRLFTSNTNTNDNNDGNDKDNNNDDDSDSRKSDGHDGVGAGEKSDAVPVETDTTETGGEGENGVASKGIRSRNSSFSSSDSALVVPNLNGTQPSSKESLACGKRRQSVQELSSGVGDGIEEAAKSSSLTSSPPRPTVPSLPSGRTPSPPPAAISLSVPLENPAVGDRQKGDDGYSSDGGKGCSLRDACEKNNLNIGSGMFSDDESDAGCSTDRESAVSSVDRPGTVNCFRNSADHSEEGSDQFVGRDGAVWRQAMGSNQSVTVRNNRSVVRGDVLPPAVAAVVTRKPSSGRNGGGGGAMAGEGGTGWSVLVEKCYVMVSCHRNHPVMFKVLKAVADAERSTRRSSAAPSSPPRYPLKGSLGSSPGSASPPRSSGNDASGSKSSRRFRSVATAAAEEAKGRHRRMIRNKFLHQVRTDKSCIEEGKKVSIACPAFLRAPLELTPTPLKLWSAAVLFGSVAEETILRALDVLLLEKTLVVCGRNLGLVSMTATALLSLLDPFKWEGVFIPVVPLKLMDVLGSPVPALVGVQAPFDPLEYAFDGVVVLDLDARRASGQLYMGGMDEKLHVSDALVRALENANTLRGRARWAGAPPTGRSPVKARGLGSRHNTPTKERYGNHPHHKSLSTGSGRASGASLGPRSHFAFQASTFMAGLTSDEKSAVVRLRYLVKANVCRLCGDLGTKGMWRKYGAFNSSTNHFEFHPGWFTEPLETRLKFQVGVARSQMFVSFVDRCRLRDLEVMPGRVQTPPKPLLSSQANNKASRGGAPSSPPLLPSRHFQAPSEGTLWPPFEFEEKAGRGSKGDTALVSPPPLPERL